MTNCLPWVIDELFGHELKLFGFEQNPEPSLLMIITGTEYAYTRSDGVVVVPLGCLKP